MVIRGLIVGDYCEKGDSFGLWGNGGIKDSSHLTCSLREASKRGPIAFSSKYMKNARVVVPGELL